MYAFAPRLGGVAEFLHADGAGRRRLGRRAVVLARGRRPGALGPACHDNVSSTSAMSVLPCHVELFSHPVNTATRVGSSKQEKRGIIEKFLPDYSKARDYRYIHTSHDVGRFPSARETPTHTESEREKNVRVINILGTSLFATTTAQRDV